MNPRLEWFKLSSEFESIRIISAGFIRIEKLVRIHSDSKSWINSDSVGSIFYQFASNEIENFFRIDSDEFGLARLQVSE